MTTTAQEKLSRICMTPRYLAEAESASNPHTRVEMEEETETIEEEEGLRQLASALIVQS